jgi:hypothetical protein
MAERDIRTDLLNTLLTTPHRDLSALHPIHSTMVRQDPLFYVHMAAWYADHGQVRDHKEMFVVMLALSDFEGHRDVGLALLRRLPIYEVARVVDFVKGAEVKVRVAPASRRRGPARSAATPGASPMLPAAPSSASAAPPPAAGAAGRAGLATRVANRLRGGSRSGAPALAIATPTGAAPPAPGASSAAVAVPQELPKVKVPTVKRGLFRNVPRSMRTEIERYLRALEQDPRAFDRAAVGSRKALKRLYAGLHIRPGKRAQAILFDEEPPEGSMAAKVRQIKNAATPAEQARLIVEHRIPYRIASTVVREMTPMVVAALVEVMTPQELINNVGSLKERGALDNPDIRALVDEKVQAAKTDRRVSAYKAKVAIEAAGITGELAEELDKVTEARVVAAGTITRPTALLIDKSGSMTPAIEAGRQLGALISAICKADLFAYAFDTVAYPIQPKGASLADWEKAMAGISAVGGTACGVALDWMRKKGQRVEQIVMVTDEGENTAPRFREAYINYADELNVRPAVILVKIGQASALLEQACTELGIAPNVFEFRGDYYALPNIIPMLTYPSLSEMVMEVLGYPLPQRLAH